MSARCCFVVRDRTPKLSVVPPTHIQRSRFCMAILHGSWQLHPQAGSFFIWGETWRSLQAATADTAEAVTAHPFGMSAAQLTEFCQSLQQSVGLRGFECHPSRSTQSIGLPTQVSEAGVPIPLHSAATPDSELSLVPWQVEGLNLSPLAAVQVLQSLPLGQIEGAEFVGVDLRFWSHVARWTLDLLVRGKFLPTLAQPSEGLTIARWQPLLDSAIDRDRLNRFAQQMPAACRSYGVEEAEFPRPAALIRGFLNEAIDVQVRSAIAGLELPKVGTPAKVWLQELRTESGPTTLKAPEIETLDAALNTWLAPVESHLRDRDLFRTCFVLLPPSSGSQDWTLAYYLQAIDDGDFLVDARTIWSHPVDRLTYLGRTIDRPQETLLSGLGLASRLYPSIEPSLQTSRPQRCTLNPIEAYEFLKSRVWRFQDSGLGVILPPSLANYESLSGRLGLSIRAESRQGGIGLQSLLAFQWELTLGGQRVSQAEFERLIRQGSPLVEINGEWVELRPGDVRAAQAFLSSRKDQMSLSLEDALRLSAGESQTIEKLPVVNFEVTGALKELMAAFSGNQAIEPIATPHALQGTLRPYQERGVGWLAFLERWGLGACLADDMGLGKTPQLIAFLLHLQEKNALNDPILVVCPTSVMGNWEREVKKFAPSLKAIGHYGSKRPKGKAFVKAARAHQVVIVSYPLVYRDLKELQQVKWQGLVLDEAQNIKNASAKQSQAVRQLEAGFRIALTGTPVENRLSELWSILDFLNPGYLGNQAFFKRRFAMPIEKFGDTASLQTLRSLAQPFILRRLKTDKDIIQDLPEKQEMTVFCPLTAQQAMLYQQVVEGSLQAIESADGIQRRGQILALLVKLKQLCNHPELVGAKASKSKLNLDELSHQSGKLQRLEEMLEELVAEGDRALIFTQFAEWGKLLQPYLENRLHRQVLFLYGSTRKDRREEMLDRFQNDPQGPPILILSLKAGGTGLNLTRANHVFHFDRWWNPAVENQATDRAFRIGQTRNVQVHKFVCTGTLEEKIHELIESKKALAEQVVDAGESWLTEMDTDRLRGLLLLDRNAAIDDE
jgi:SNF2 family DNA or RNA helicase